jgi:hypothetical protein
MELARTLMELTSTVMLHSNKLSGNDNKLFLKLGCIDFCNTAKNNDVLKKVFPYVG